MAVEEIHKKEKKLEGIHSMRADRFARNPEFPCENCGCKRYSPCSCIKGHKTEEKSKAIQDGTPV